MSLIFSSTAQYSESLVKPLYLVPVSTTSQQITDPSSMPVQNLVVQTITANYNPGAEAGYDYGDYTYQVSFDCLIAVLLFADQIDGVGAKNGDGYYELPAGSYSLTISSFFDNSFNQVYSPDVNEQNRYVDFFAPRNGEQYLAVRFSSFHTPDAAPYYLIIDDQVPETTDVTVIEYPRPFIPLYGLQNADDALTPIYVQPGSALAELIEWAKTSQVPVGIPGSYFLSETYQVTGEYDFILVLTM